MRAIIVGLLAALVIAAPHIECGACGAHVSEWAYIRGYSGPVAVCMDCYHIEP